MNWTPADEGGLTAWYRVEDLSLSDNDTVTTWADQSGNSRDLTGFNAPTYKTGITPNGSSVVRLDGVDDGLRTGLFTTDSDGLTSLWFYGKVTGDSSTQVIVYHGNTATNGYGIFQDSSNVIKGIFGGETSWGTVSDSSNFRSLGLIVNFGGSPAGDLLIDNASNATTATNYLGNAGVRFGIGYDPQGSTHFAKVDVCEVVYFDHILDATARANLQAYFETKYITAQPALTDQAWG